MASSCEGASLTGLGAGAQCLAAALQLQHVLPPPSHIASLADRRELCCVVQQEDELLCLLKVSRHSTNTARAPWCSGKITITCSISPEDAESILEPRSFCSLSALGIRHIIFTASLLQSLDIHRMTWDDIQRGYACLSPLHGTRCYTLMDCSP